MTNGPIPPKPSNPGAGNGAPAQLSISGGAAIVAPVSSFQGGIPTNALIVLPVASPSPELGEKLAQGPIVVTQEQMWQLLGFNGPAVQVQDDQGRPIAIGLEDLLTSLQKHWDEAPEDVARGRGLAQELLKHGRLDRAEVVLAKLVARGGSGDDWLALGVTQLQLGKLDKAEGTLRGAQNLMPDNPYPSLHLAKVAQQRGDHAAERELAGRAVAIDGNSVDAWGVLFQTVREADGEDKAIAAIEELAAAPVHAKSVAPFIAVQGFYANDEKTRDAAKSWCQRAIDRDPSNPLGLLCLSALHGQSGDLQAVIDLLGPAEALMLRDVRLANNYFEALFQSRQIERVTKLLNVLAGSPNREVKQFAIERSRAVAQFLQQQQAQLAATGQPRK